MNISGYDIQPILLYIPDTPEWLERWRKGREHFAEAGLKNIISVPGIYGKGFGIEGTHLYELDNPGGGHKIGTGNTALYLSMYMVYNIENNLPNTHFLFLEDDTRFNEDFLRDLRQALWDVPNDFDFLFIGSCCAMDKPKVHIAGNVYRFDYDESKGPYPSQYPMGGNAYIIAKKCLPFVISTQRDAYANVDISLGMHTFPHLKVYAILPRLCEQDNNPLPV